MGERGLWLGKESFTFAKSETGDKSFSGVSYSGDAITDRLVMGSDGNIYDKLVIDVQGAKEKTLKSNPALRVGVFYNHDQNQILGNGKLSFENNIQIAGKFSSFTPEASKIYSMMKDEDFPMQQSVYVETDNIEGFRKGSVTVNGRTFDAPVAVFRNGNIREVSLCPIGADPNTSAEVFSVNTTKGEKPMTINIEKFTYLNDEQKKEFQKIAETDMFAAVNYAAKFCPCAEAAEAEKAAAAKKEEDEKAAAAKAESEKKTDEPLKAEISKLTSSVSELLKKVDATDKKIEVSPELLAKEDNPTGNAQLKTVIEKTEELMKANPSLSYAHAYAEASKPARTTATA